jgi:Prokaryotic E2 family E
VTILDQQLEELQKEFPLAETVLLPDGSSLIHIPNVPLAPSGWNKKVTSVYFIAPVGYPVAQPDCFWTDEDLRIASSGGAPPKNSAVQQPPFAGGPKLWFSWHVSSWIPNRDNLKSYLRIVQDRLARAE